MSIENLIPLAAIAFLVSASVSIISIGSSMFSIRRKMDEFVDAYINSEYCECPCHEEEKKEWR